MAASTNVFGDQTNLNDADRLLREGKFEPASKSLAEFRPHSQEERFRLIMLQGKLALGLGDPQRAVGYFEPAGSQFGEKTEAELWQLRAHLQGGAFREAMAFANLVAGEHADSTEAQALLALVEDRAGQTERALAKLKETRAKLMDDVALLAAEAEIFIDRSAAERAAQSLDLWIGHNPPNGDVFRLRARAAMAMGNREESLRFRARAVMAYEGAGEAGRAALIRDWLDKSDPSAKITGAMLSAKAGQAALPLRQDHAGPAAPSAWPEPFFETIPMSTSTGLAGGNGFVIDNGQRVVTSARLAAGSPGEVWVRNGLGHVRKARVESVHAKEGLAILRLEQAYDPAWSLSIEQVRVPNGGSFCFVLGYPLADSLDKVYPIISPGLVFRADAGAGGLMQLTSDLGRDSGGSPVFDDAGHLIGVAVGKEDKLEGGKDIASVLGEGNFAIRSPSLLSILGKKSDTGKPSKPAVVSSSEELYERMLPAVVLVFAVR